MIIKNCPMRFKVKYDNNHLEIKSGNKSVTSTPLYGE